jgi:hypothetical protein
MSAADKVWRTSTLSPTQRDAPLVAFMLAVAPSFLFAEAASGAGAADASILLAG